jgi:hypothetical protein
MHGLHGAFASPCRHIGAALAPHLSKSRPDGVATAETPFAARDRAHASRSWKWMLMWANAAGKCVMGVQLVLHAVLSERAAQVSRLSLCPLCHVQYRCAITFARAGGARPLLRQVHVSAARLPYGCGCCCMHASWVASGARAPSWQQTRRNWLGAIMQRQAKICRRLRKLCATQNHPTHRKVAHKGRTTLSKEDLSLLALWCLAGSARVTMHNQECAQLQGTTAAADVPVRHLHQYTCESL